MSCDILNLEWSSRGRDVDIVEPVLGYLEAEHGLKVVREGIYNSGWKLLRHRPRMLVIADQGGARVNFETVRLATRMGIPVVTLRSEGMFRDDPETVVQMFWGWNGDHHLYEVLHLEWTQRNIDLAHRDIPESREYDMRVSGATGFDRFKLMHLETKQQFLARRGRQGFDYLVGIAGWTFSHVAGGYYRDHAAKVANVLGGHRYVEMHREALPMLRQAYRHLVESSPETLFVLRYHPGETEEQFSEFAGLGDLPNVLTSRRQEDNTADLVSACDAWLAYESTTCLEAWLCGTPTLLVNPLGGDFPRSPISSGAPLAMTGEETATALGQLRETGRLPGFEELADGRKAVVRDTIGWADGCNHRRAADHVVSVLDRRPPRQIDGSVMRLLVTATLAQLSPRLPQVLRTRPPGVVATLRERFDSEERERERLRYRDAILAHRESPCTS
jgi:hypothetical protein